jgi:hypothetical protein
MGTISIAGLLALVVVGYYVFLRRSGPRHKSDDGGDANAMAAAASDAAASAAASSSVDGSMGGSSE